MAIYYFRLGALSQIKFNKKVKRPDRKNKLAVNEFRKNLHNRNQLQFFLDFLNSLSKPTISYSKSEYRAAVRRVVRKDK